MMLCDGTQKGVVSGGVMFLFGKRGFRSTTK
jgi:hypothetical protein